MSIKLLVGLGNPGSKYAQTRHNAGFWLVDGYARDARLSFRHERDFEADVAKAPSGWLLKPQTYMNLSGKSVGALARFYKIEPEEILVAHDELDLLPGVVKIKRGGGHAGHNGLRDIGAQLGTADFWRLRIGIGHPRTLNLPQEVVDFVLHPPGREDETLISEAIERSLKVLPEAFTSSMDAVVMKLHSNK